MLEKLLPDRIINAINNVPYKTLCELRLRADSPIVVNVLGKNYFLSDNALVENESEALICTQNVLCGVVRRLTQNSLYSVNDQLIQGFITYDGGIRVGVSGEIVVINSEVKTIKNIKSINIRFPHMVKNCSLNILPYIFDGYSIKNTLIISAPGVGKTTYLRDIIYQISTRNNLLNVLVVDERQELISVFDGNEISNITNVDIYSNSSKKFAFNNGIRSMGPNVIVTDEISIDKDIADIENALTSGVSVVASIHAGSIHDLKNKSGFQQILMKKLFDRYIVLSRDNGLGCVEAVYNENLNCIGV